MNPKDIEILEQISIDLYNTNCVQVASANPPMNAESSLADVNLEEPDEPRLHRSHSLANKAIKEALKVLDYTDVESEEDVKNSIEALKDYLGEIEAELEDLHSIGEKAIVAYDYMADQYDSNVAFLHQDGVAVTEAFKQIEELVTIRQNKSISKLVDKIEAIKRK